MKKVGKIPISCKKCGKIRFIFPILLKKGRGKYCSVSCARRDNPPNWMHQNYEGRGRKIGDAIIKGNWREERASAWKGDKVSYWGLHLWVNKHLGHPDTCIRCGKKGTGHRMHWSNISGEYKRELTDWQRLCPICHKAYDKELKQRRYSYET